MLKTSAECTETRTVERAKKKLGRHDPGGVLAGSKQGEFHKRFGFRVAGLALNLTMLGDQWLTLALPMSHISVPVLFRV